MQPAAAILSSLHGLTFGESSGDLEQCVSDLAESLRTVTTSYCGIQLTLTQNGHPVVLTALEAHPDPVGSARTSLRLPLARVGPGHEDGSRIVLFAGTPGAFVDLAADLDHLLKPPATVLDADLPLSTASSGLSGTEELSTINRAIGFLIEAGHHPDEAYPALRGHAAGAGLTPFAWARQFLQRP